MENSWTGFELEAILAAATILIALIIMMVLIDYVYR